VASSVDAVYRIVSINNGYLAIPLPPPNMGGATIDMDKAVYAATPKELGEALALMLTTEILED